jgi:dolichyl-phosphate-mannose-protein mannosyltransferase
MDRAVALPRARRALALPRVAGWPALAAVVALSTLIRTLVAFRRETPAYFPDEYMYSELGRSLAESGRPLIRGAGASFPALLQPLATAPAWLLDDVATAYHAIQVMNALAMSLTAVPVYLLARRLGTDWRLALAAAAATVAVPDLLYVGWIVSEPFAYPLVATAVLLGVRALERPQPRAQAAFLLVSGLAAFARVQFFVLPVCFVAAAFVVGARGRTLRQTVREQWLAAGAVALALAAVMGRGGDDVGLYKHVLTLDDVAPASVASQLATQSLALLYASGWVIVPGAVLGLVLALARPRSRGELAFGALTLSLLLALLLQASLWGEPAIMQERYTFYAVPLLATAFALFASRGWPWRRAHTAACAGLLIVASTVPLSTYVAHFGNRHSIMLFAVTRSEQTLGVGGGALAVAAVAGLLALVAALLGLSRRTAGLILALALVASGGTGIAAASYDLGKNDSVRRAYLPADPSWVDHASVGDVALVYSRGHYYRDGLEQLFWNRSVSRILLLPAAGALDSFVTSQIEIGRDGTLLVGGRPLRLPLLVDSRVAKMRLRDATLVATSPAYDLWKPAGAAKLYSYAVGWYRDGWLARRSFEVWAPRIAGRVRFRIKGPRGRDSTLTISTPRGRTVMRVGAGVSRTIELTACGRSSWRATFASDYLVLAPEGVESLQATQPVWTPDRAACRTGP